MFLINTDTGRLGRFDDDKIFPPFAILSHTWSDLEFSLQGIKGSHCRDDGIRSSVKVDPGISRYLLCVDKTSSADLGKAHEQPLR